MKVGLYYPADLPESFRVCADNISRELQDLGIVCKRFDTTNAPPADIDLLWDPRAGGGNPPLPELCEKKQPLVVTLHGVAPMAIPLTQYYSTLRLQYRGWRSNRRKRAAWRALRGQYAAVVTVSASSRESILANLPIDPNTISWCHNAVDHALYQSREAVNESDYLLHISNDEPRKNIDRIYAAYAKLPTKNRPRLVLKLPTGSRRPALDGVTVISERLSDAAILDLYQSALGFIFPSSFEGFGLPIVEAMAAGCPVVTSKTHACGEVAGSAALLVDPDSVNELTEAMHTIASSRKTRETLRQAGLQRAKDFRWSEAAKHYMNVFEKALSSGKNRSGEAFKN